MSTRAVIARLNSNGFAGVYHHWDGYPTGLGATLFTLFNGHFKQDLGAMLKYLIDEHPAGWSTINDQDFTKPPGFDSSGPQCYCHGNRNEEGHVYTDKNAQSSGCEWAYAFQDKDGKSLMHVLSSYSEGGHKMIGMFGMGDQDAKWFMIATVDLTAAEPDWKKIESTEPAVS